MTSYAASKAGVEALSNSLRAEVVSRGVDVGCAYFGFIDTDMVRDAISHESTRVALGLLPGFVRKAVSVDHAVNAIERGIAGRRDRVWAPRYVGSALAARGWMQPLTERYIRRSKRIDRAIELAQQAPARERELV